MSGERALLGTYRGHRVYVDRDRIRFLCYVPGFELESTSYADLCRQIDRWVSWPPATGYGILVTDVLSYRIYVRPDGTFQAVSDQPNGGVWYGNAHEYYRAASLEGEAHNKAEWKPTRPTSN